MKYRNLDGQVSMDTLMKEANEEKSRKDWERQRHAPVTEDEIDFIMCCVDAHIDGLVKNGRSTPYISSEYDLDDPDAESGTDFEKSCAYKIAANGYTNNDFEFVKFVLGEYSDFLEEGVYTDEPIKGSWRNDIRAARALMLKLAIKAGAHVPRKCKAAFAESMFFFGNMNIAGSVPHRA